ncbi:MAG: cytochrome-c oxidase, cbb3-type subunit I [Alphaproteobacteria bacterium]
MTQANGLAAVMGRGGEAVLSALAMIIVLVGGVAALYIASRSPDVLMQVHATIFFVAAVIALFVLMLRFGRRVTGQAVGARDAEGYNMAIIKVGVGLAMFWAVIGLLAGVVVALQLAYPALNLNYEWTTFGRLRPLHTSAVIFAFGGTVLLTTSFYVVQRTCQARLFSDLAAWFVLWGYQLFIVIAATGYVLGVTQGREYAEPEWYTDLWLTIVWVVYLLVFLGTIWKRKEPHIYVANWFYLSFIVTIAMLHIVNNLAMPVSFLGTKSYSLFAGVQDALTQWWYGHNAVGFFLTTGFLAIMYYFVPKQAGRPVYSYRLSIVHFWSLIFIYIWAGPHHLHYTALPEWAQTLGMTFSIMLWMPSWGGAINGVMTLSGAWDKFRTDPVLRMMVVSVAFYAMSTFEGPLLSIKEVNALSHYTDWTIGHVHSGALGWVGFISFGAMYALAPWIWGRREIYSKALVEVHFWIATIGILLYITTMWVSGIMQGLMWRSYTELGFLEFSFIETTEAMHPMYVGRALGGVLYLIGAIVMAYNLWMTARNPDPAPAGVTATAKVAA